jgi:hypothetical protein
MSRALVVGVCAALLMAGCTKPRLAPAAQRMEVRTVTGNTVQFIPGRDQLPYCLIYTQSDKGVTRQMTMTQSNQSVPCPAGEPVLGLRFRIPADEGRVRVRVLFSDMRLQAAEVAEQVVEMDNPTFNPINLRLPGRVLLESMDFIPTEEAPPVIGAVLKPPASDAGSLSGRR